MCRSRDETGSDNTPEARGVVCLEKTWGVGACRGVGGRGSVVGVVVFGLDRPLPVFAPPRPGPVPLLGLRLEQPEQFVRHVPDWRKVSVLVKRLPCGAHPAREPL